MNENLSKKCHYSDRHKRRLAKRQTDLELNEVYKRNARSITKNEIDDNSTPNIFSTNNEVILGDVEVPETIPKLQDDYEEITSEDICIEQDICDDVYSICTTISEELCAQYDCDEVDDNAINNGRKVNSDSEMSDEDDIYGSLFVDDIRRWAISFNIPQNALSSLLSILAKRTKTKFPKQARTLMGTPKSTNLVNMGSGEYYHFGLKSAVQKLLYERTAIDIDNKLLLLISTDGAPIGKSSTKSFWPILCSDFNSSINVQIIGIFLGNSKPEKSDDFFKSFVDEAIQLVNEGLVYNNTFYEIRIHGLICDAPAKSFALNVKYHSGYSSCTKCDIYGETIDGTICFPRATRVPILRTDELFHNLTYIDDYQKSDTLLKNIPKFGLVSNVPLDYMHLVCLGVMRKLLLLWLKGPLPWRLSSSQVTEISNSLLHFRQYLPSDFARKPRSLKHVAIWKATEYRLFLLYIGVIVLKNILKEEAYLNFCALHVAIRILASPHYIRDSKNIKYAEDLLQYFVISFQHLYGPKRVSYNIHNLTHLASDVRKFGHLDKFSAFPFENYIRSIKQLIRKGDKPLQQIVRRLAETEYVNNHVMKLNKSNALQVVERKHLDGPLTDDRNYVLQFRILRAGSLYINSHDGRNDCILIEKDVISIVHNFAKTANNHLYVIGEQLSFHKDLFEKPCNSNNLSIGIFRPSGQIKSWSCTKIVAKLCKLPVPHGCAVLPILHTCNTPN